jgi:uncharacterized membrane protein YfcA
MTPKTAIFLALAGFACSYAAAWLASLRRMPPESLRKPSVPEAATGFITNFFDTLGIGSFATTTSIFKFWRMIPDERIPGTLNVGHTAPVIVQAFIYVSVIEVEMVTLIALIGAAVIGAWFGAGVVVRLPRRKVQLGMGAALVIAACAMLMSQLALFPAGGEALSLRDARLVAGMAGLLVFAAVSTIGIGFYAPIMILVSLLGMNPIASFPIMMGAGAFLMPVSSVRFLRSQAYAFPAAAGLAAGGLLAVPLAAFVVKSLPLAAVRWLVIVVVLYAAALMLRSAREEKAAAVSNL